jgi:lipopolysaccharide biosynthesis protein
MKIFAYWHTKTIVADLKYLRDISFYLLTKKETCGRPLLRYIKRGRLAPHYDKPVCLFCSYDKESIIRENVYHYLNELSLAGFNIVFISSSDTIRDEDLKKLSECCIKIISRENRGYDFYGWKTGLQEYPEHSAHSALLLANDSVIGPLFSIRDIIARLENHDADIVGMTDCPRFHPHLQSYFLYCKKPVIASDEFLGFFKRVEVVGFKMAIIRKYEVGFSRLLGRRFRISALYSLKSALDRIPYAERPKSWIDPPLQLWKPFITELKFPFLKKSLLTKRGVGIEEVSAALAESGSTYNVDILADWIMPES